MVGVEKECIDAFLTGEKEETLKLLPKLRSPETIRDSRYAARRRYTLVHYAVRCGWEDVCKLLVEKYNCDPTAVDDNRCSPLHVACFYGKEAVVKYLVSLPSVLRRINDKDDIGHTPLHEACLNQNLGVVEILFETNSVNILEKNAFSGDFTFEMLSKYSYNLLSRATSKIDWNTQLKVNSYFNMFLAGNSGAGKSTLAAVMLELTRFAPTQHGRISKVKEFTTGIVPTQCEG